MPDRQQNIEISAVSMVSLSVILKLVVNYLKSIYNFFFFRELIRRKTAAFEMPTLPSQTTVESSHCFQTLKPPESHFKVILGNCL